MPAEPLSSLRLRAVYDKAVDDIAASFYIPCMQRAHRYDRISGYFSSAVYVVAWEALKEFIAADGRIRLICSPFLPARDIEGIERGYQARSESELAAVLNAEFQQLAAEPTLAAPSKVLAWLIAHGLLEIQIARVASDAPGPEKRMFHDKVGVFEDAQGNAVGFRGTMNETYLGLSSDGNIDSIDVFPSWLDPRDIERVELAKASFEALWQHRVQGVEVLALPDETKALMATAAADIDSAKVIDEIVAGIRAKRAEEESAASEGLGDRITLKRHQTEVLESWEAANFRGIVEHATGSGKTFTALAAIRRWTDSTKPALILVPSNLLVTQWTRESSVVMGEEVDLLVAGAGQNEWRNPAVVRRWMRPRPGERRILLATYQTASTAEFLRVLGQPEDLLVVADEVHRAGSPRFQQVFQIDALGRLGLSATPRRYNDPEGTAAIFEYFGNVLKPRYGLAEAINDGVLTRYDYHPHVVSLDEHEAEDWRRLTKEIRRRYAMVQSQREDPGGDDRIKTLMRQRARIVRGASSKTELAARIIQADYHEGEKWLVYCDDTDQLADVRARLRAVGFPSLEYRSAMQADKPATLQAFEINGGILVAIKCLDEGVDIPAVTHALILASSRNPREFIQRRGRVLRRFPGKWLSHVHDALVVPDDVPEGDGTADAAERLLWAELARSIEFGRWANNPQCVTELERICIAHDIDFRVLLEVGEEDDDGD